MPERICPFADCNTEISREMFACRKHWFGLSKELKEEVQAAYSGWLKGTISGEELRVLQQAILDRAEGR